MRWLSLYGRGGVVLTVQILAKNNEKTIGRTLESLSGLDLKVLVGDLGSSDATTEICSRYGAEVRKVAWGGDYSEARNSLVSDGMNLMLEPWEVLAKGREEIIGTVGNFRVTVVRGSSVSKELRLWGSGRFRNPVYETVDDEGSEYLDGVAIVGSGWPDRRTENLDLCRLWRERRPTSPEPWYYSALSALALGRLDEFLSFSERYMAMTEDFGPPETHMAYKMSRVLFGKGHFSKAAGLLGMCLFHNPTMAEFWCLFGDAFYRRKDYAKARSMYRNAIIMGGRRSSSDPAPLEIDKYREHPEKMMAVMDEMDRTTGVIGTK